MDERDKKKLLEILHRLYPDPKSELNFANHFQLIISVVLSAQCTDRKVNEVTPALFARFPDFARLAQASPEEVETIIRAVNYYRTKARNIISLAARITADYAGALPRRQEELVELPGVGRKTANVVLSELGDVPAFPVDTHVFRVARRLGLSRGETPEKVEEDLRDAFPPSKWRELHHWMIFHGRRVCTALKPNCEGCALNKLCPSAFRVGTKQDSAHRKTGRKASGGNGRARRPPKTRRSELRAKAGKT